MPKYEATSPSTRNFPTSTAAEVWTENTLAVTTTGSRYHMPYSKATLIGLGVAFIWHLTKQARTLPLELHLL